MPQQGRPRGVAVVASAQTEVVVTKQRVTGCTIIEIYEDGKVVSVYYRYDNLE